MRFPPEIQAYRDKCIQNIDNTVWTRAPDFGRQLQALATEIACLRKAMLIRYTARGNSDLRRDWRPAYEALERTAIDYYKLDGKWESVTRIRDECEESDTGGSNSHERYRIRREEALRSEQRTAVSEESREQYDKLVAALNTFDAIAAEVAAVNGWNDQPDPVSARTQVLPEVIAEGGTAQSAAPIVPLDQPDEHAGGASKATFVPPDAFSHRQLECVAEPDEGTTFQPPGEVAKDPPKDGPRKGLKFYFGGKPFKFDRSERRLYRLLEAMWPAFRLRESLTDAEAVQAYEKAGGSCVEWKKLKEYARLLNPIIRERLKLPAELESGVDYIGWVDPTDG